MTVTQVSRVTHASVTAMSPTGVTHLSRRPVPSRPDPFPYSIYRGFSLLTNRSPIATRSALHEPPAGQTLGARITKTKNVTTDRARGNQRDPRNDRQEQQA